MSKKISALLVILLLVCATVPAAFADEEVGEVANVMNSAAPIPAGHFAIIAHYADIYLSNTEPGRGPARALPVTDFVDTLTTKKFRNLNDYYIIDIRTADKYVTGHIPGAVNVPFATIAKAENLVTYPIDGRPILVICPTGHTASMTSSILNTLGYNAWVIKGGMSVWTCQFNDPAADYYCEK